MLSALLNLFRKRRELHPTETGNMERSYDIPQFGKFMFDKGAAIAGYTLSTELWGEAVEIKLDVKTPDHMSRAAACLKRLDKKWFDEAILYTADHEHMPIEDFGGEPKYWIDRDTFMSNIRKNPSLEVLFEEEEEEGSVSLYLNDGDLFGGHYIWLLADERGKIDHVGVHG